MENLFKLVIYGLAFFLMLGVFIVFLPLLLAAAVVLFAIERIFGVKVMRFTRLSEAKRRWSPFDRHAVREDLNSGNVIDAEVIDLPDEPPKQE